MHTRPISLENAYGNIPRYSIGIRHPDSVTHRWRFRVFALTWAAGPQNIGLG